MLRVKSTSHLIRIFGIYIQCNVLLIDSYIISGDKCRHLEDDISVDKIVRELR